MLQQITEVAFSSGIHSVDAGQQNADAAPVILQKWLPESLQVSCLATSLLKCRKCTEPYRSDIAAACAGMLKNSSTPIASSIVTSGLVSIRRRCMSFGVCCGGAQIDAAVMRRARPESVTFLPFKGLIVGDSR